MRIAYLPTRYPVLSETFVSLEVEGLREAGHQVDVISVWEGNAVGTTDPGEQLWQDQGVGALLGAHARIAARHPARYAAFLRLARASQRESEACWRHLPWWAEELQRRGTHVLHAHFAWSSATRAWALSLLSGIPWVVTAHAHDIFASPQRLVDKMEAADAAITVCDYNRAELEALGVRRPMDIVVCGVTDPGPPAALAPGADIAFVGRLVPKKGADVLLEALALLASRGSTPSVDVVGDGPELDGLRARAEELGLRRVTFHGARPHEESLALVAAARVFCLPARIAADGDRDSMPVVVKEAMVRAVPIVATAVVAIPEMVDDEVGWLVRPEDPEQLAQALAEALADPAEARRRGEAGRARVLERFLERDQVAILERIYARW